MSTHPLCKCNKCGTIMIDKNPQSGAKELTIPDNVKDMAFVEDSDGGIWACPVCKTDEHLIDL